MMYERLLLFNLFNILSFIRKASRLELLFSDFFVNPYFIVAFNEKSLL